MPCFSLRPVALCVASLWAASTSFSAEVVQAPAAPSGRDNTGQPVSSPPDAAPAPAPTSTTTTLKPIDVTAKRLRDARIELSPQVGTTVYSVTPAFIESLGKGAADLVLLLINAYASDHITEVVPGLRTLIFNTQHEEMNVRVHSILELLVGTPRGLDVIDM